MRCSKGFSMSISVILVIIGSVLAVNILQSMNRYKFLVNNDFLNVQMNIAANNILVVGEAMVKNNNFLCSNSTVSSITIDSMIELVPDSFDVDINCVKIDAVPNYYKMSVNISLNKLDAFNLNKTKDRYIQL